VIAQAAKAAAKVDQGIL